MLKLTGYHSKTGTVNSSSFGKCSGYPTYWNTRYDKEEHLADHKSFIEYSVYQGTCLHDEFSHLYWIWSIYMMIDDNYFRQMCVFVNAIQTPTDRD
jgi:hypothetical protein